MVDNWGSLIYPSLPVHIDDSSPLKLRCNSFIFLFIVGAFIHIPTSRPYGWCASQTNSSSPTSRCLQANKSYYQQYSNSSSSYHWRAGKELQQKSSPVSDKVVHARLCLLALSCSCKLRYASAFTFSSKDSLTERIIHASCKAAL
jgi:hypothetical protein